MDAVKNKIQWWERALFGKSPPTLPRISWSFIMLILAIGLAIPILVVRIGKMMDLPQIWITLANSALTLLVTWGAVRLGQLSWGTIGLIPKDFPREIVIGIGLFLVFETARVLAIVVQGRELASITIEPLQVLDAAGQALSCAFAEEVFYRGLVISFLLGQFQRRDLAALISSIIFALSHLHLGLSPLELLRLTASGAIYALLYIWRGYNLTVPIVAHTLWNFAAVLRS